MPVDAEGDNRVGEGGVLARDDEIARPDEHQAAGDHLSLDLRDRRPGKVAPPPAVAEEDLLLERHVLRGTELEQGAEADEVVPGREVPPVRREHDHLHAFVVHSEVEGSADLPQHQLVLSVVLLRPGQRDTRDAGDGQVVADPLEACLHGSGWYAWTIATLQAATTPRSARQRAADPRTLRTSSYRIMVVATVRRRQPLEARDREPAGSRVAWFCRGGRSRVPAFAAGG